MRYQWVPSHVGLSGYQQADLDATTGAQRVGRPDLTLRPSTSDLVRRVNRAAWSLWAKDYREDVQRVGRPDLTLPPSTSDLVRRVTWAACSLWTKDYREAALHHNWPITECQGDSTETLFPRHPPQVGQLSRIRLNCWKRQYTLARCP